MSSRCGRTRSRRRRCACVHSERKCVYLLFHLYIYSLRSVDGMIASSASFIVAQNALVLATMLSALGCDWIQAVQWPFQVEVDAYLAHLLICGAYAFSWCYNLFANVCRSMGRPLAASHGMRAPRTTCISIIIMKYKNCNCCARIANQYGQKCRCRFMARQICTEIELTLSSNQLEMELNKLRAVLVFEFAYFVLQFGCVITARFPSHWHIRSQSDALVVNDLTRT